MSDIDTKLTLARKLTEMGLPLFLVRPNDKRPLRRGWRQEATTDPTTICEHLRQNPDANLGVATGGRRGLLVVDIDPRHNGDKSIEALEAAHGPLAKTLTVTTGGGGRHIYFQLPTGISTRNTAGQLADGIDTRGDGGYVVAPGSIHPDGGIYVIENDATQLAAAPDWLIEKLKRRGDRPASKTGGAAKISSDSAFAEGRRNTDMFSLAGYMRNKGAGEVEILGALRGLNDELASPLPDDEIISMSHGVTRYDPTDFISHTERSLADEFAKISKDTLAYAPELGWLHYSAGAWSPDAGDQRAQERAKEFVHEIEHRARIAANRENDSQAANKIVRSALRWQRAASVRNIVKLAESDPVILSAAQDFDAQTTLLNLTNGTFDLEKRQLRPHQASDRLRKKTNITFDPDARCPLFDKFIIEILGTEKAEFILRAFAYSLLGKPIEQKMFVLTGAGRNGKTTLTELMREMLGDYALVLDPTSLLRKNLPTVGNDIARLNGARFALTSEFSKGALIDIPLIKKLTGNESISARFLYRETFQFDSKAVFFLVSNHAPVIDGSDMALARRLVVVPFDVVVPEASVDPNLKAKLNDERSGIFNRLLQALTAYQSDGLKMPAAISAATSRYTFEHDVVAQFIASECAVRGEATAGSQSLYARFRTYCFDNGLQAMSDRYFKKTLEGKGFTQRRVSTGMIWTGLEMMKLPARLRAA